MINFKKWFYENIDDLYKHPHQKRNSGSLDASYGLVMKVTPPSIDHLPDNLHPVIMSHITLIRSKDMLNIRKKVEDMLKNADEEIMDLPKPIFGKQVIASRPNGKIGLIAEILNQEDFRNYVEKIWNKLGIENPRNMYYHISLANNFYGDPKKSIGDIKEEDFIN